MGQHKKLTPAQLARYEPTPMRYWSYIFLSPMHMVLYIPRLIIRALYGQYLAKDKQFVADLFRDHGIDMIERISLFLWLINAVDVDTNEFRVVNPLMLTLAIILSVSVFLLREARFYLELRDGDIPLAYIAVAWYFSVLAWIIWTIIWVTRFVLPFFAHPHSEETSCHDYRGLLFETIEDLQLEMYLIVFYLRHVLPAICQRRYSAFVHGHTLFPHVELEEEGHTLDTLMYETSTTHDV